MRASHADIPSPNRSARAGQRRREPFNTSLLGVERQELVLEVSGRYGRRSGPRRSNALVRAKRTDGWRGRSRHGRFCRGRSRCKRCRWGGGRLGWCRRRGRSARSSRREQRRRSRARGRFVQGRCRAWLAPFDDGKGDKEGQRRDSEDEEQVAGSGVAGKLEVVLGYLHGVGHGAGAEVPACGPAAEKTSEAARSWSAPRSFSNGGGSCLGHRRGNRGAVRRCPAHGRRRTGRQGSRRGCNFRWKLRQMKVAADDRSCSSRFAGFQRIVTATAEVAKPRLGTGHR